MEKVLIVFVVMIFGTIGIVAWKEDTTSLEYQRSKLQRCCSSPVWGDNEERCCKEVARFDSVYSQVLINQINK